MKHKRLIITLSIIGIVLLSLLAACTVYLCTYYKADKQAMKELSYSGYTEIRVDEGAVAYLPKDPSVGIIFYPGGKVERDAYIPLMRCLAEKGVLCILPDMPFNLAVFDVDRAKGLKNGFVSVNSWYMAGHSLGGSMACSYIKDNLSEFDGVILLASYSTEDLSKTDLRVLSIYGSNDKVLNREKYDEYKSNLPPDLEEYVIEGGNHAMFGVYGEQSGDGEAAITNKAQIEITRDRILEFMK